MPTPCEIAEKGWQQSRLWLNLWNFLLYVFGIAVIGFLIFTIIYSVRENWATAAIGLIGTIATGGGVSFVVTQRKTAADDELAARNLAIQECRPVHPAGHSPGVPVPAGDIETRMNQFAAKHNWFG